MFNQKGYIGQSMSENAKFAYDSGLLSKAKISKYDLESADIDLPVGFIKSLMPTIITPTEWHHTGKFYNATDFYDMQDVKEQLADIDIDRHLEIYKKEQEEKRLEQERKRNEKGYYAYLEYGEWGGTRKHPKLTHFKDYAFIKGKWAYINEFTKKKIDGKHFEILKTYKIKPKAMSTAARDKIFKKLKHD